ncbi:MAG: thiamine phosphate synthase [Acidobacteria bacterium]|nr:thiamine phosphate synthase [Acidobacteriota bacterium]
MLLYYITARRQFSGTEAAQQAHLLAKIAEAARAGVDFIQLREKDLPSRALESLAREAVRAVRDQGPAKLLLNSRTDVALGVGADGVHLPSSDISAAEVRGLWPQSILSVSCHAPTEVAAASSADYALFAPVFEKQGATPTGLDALREACGHKTPVLALGGITLENASACVQAGAAGIAAIRLFQDHDVAEIVRRLRRT